ncbi:MAG: prolipoprotein diacylglyceryl transferase [Burkholderiales bacterium]|nr:prolipoprotein diacylglyceryl transferase [Burkholderiales bacterium]
MQRNSLFLNVMLHSLAGQIPHEVLELLGYSIGARLYWRQARLIPRPPQQMDRWLIIAAAIFGAFIGSKLLHILEHLPYLLRAQDWHLWLGGKSVLGGFLGGTLGVELAKRTIAWRTATGDAWIPALPVGLMIGRIGCQVSGLWDQTFGVPTSLPWAWDYGDHIGRHPAAAYEIILVGLLAWAVMRHVPRGSGRRYALFMAGYCVIRVVLEFIKPPFGLGAPGTLPVTLYLHLTAIQWAAVLGMGYFAHRFYKLGTLNRDSHG